MLVLHNTKILKTDKGQSKGLALDKLFRITSCSFKLVY